MEKEDKKALLDDDYCPHRKKGWFEHQYICADCGLVFENGYSLENEPGYSFRNQIMRGRLR